MAEPGRTRSGLTYGASTLKVFLAMSKEFREVESKNRRLTAPDHPASTPFHHHHQTSISIHRTPSKALNLPPEVRNSIYRYSLTIANPDRMYELIERPNVALLRTNKQIYGEAAQVFGMCNEFIRFSTDCLAALTGRDLPGLVFANLRRGTDLLQGEDPQVIDRLRSTNTSVKAYPRCILDVGAYITRQSGYYEGSGAAERSISAGDDVSTTNANTISVTDITLPIVYSEQASLDIQFPTPFGADYRPNTRLAILKRITQLLHGFKKVRLSGPGLDEQIKTTALSNFACRRWDRVHDALNMLRHLTQTSCAAYNAGNYGTAIADLRGVFRGARLVQVGRDGAALAREGGPDFSRALLRIMQYNGINLLAVCLTCARLKNIFQERFSEVVRGYRWFKEHNGGSFNTFVGTAPPGWSERICALLMASQRLSFPYLEAYPGAELFTAPSSTGFSELRTMEAKLFKEAQNLREAYLVTKNKTTKQLTNGETAELIAMMDHRELEIRGHEPDPYPFLI